MYCPFTGINRFVANNINAREVFRENVADPVTNAAMNQMTYLHTAAPSGSVISKAVTATPSAVDNATHPDGYAIQMGDVESINTSEMLHITDFVTGDPRFNAKAFNFLKLMIEHLNPRKLLEIFCQCNKGEFAEMIKSLIKTHLLEISQKAADMTQIAQQKELMLSITDKCFSKIPELRSLLLEIYRARSSFLKRFINELACNVFIIDRMSAGVVYFTLGLTCFVSGIPSLQASDKADELMKGTLSVCAGICLWMIILLCALERSLKVCREDN